jgi:hypothetical protein
MRITDRQQTSLSRVKQGFITFAGTVKPMRLAKKTDANSQSAHSMSCAMSTSTAQAMLPIRSLAHGNINRNGSLKCCKQARFALQTAKIETLKGKLKGQGNDARA